MDKLKASKRQSTNQRVTSPWRRSQPAVTTLTFSSVFQLAKLSAFRSCSYERCCILLGRPTLSQCCTLNFDPVFVHGAKACGSQKERWLAYFSLQLGAQHGFFHVSSLCTSCPVPRALRWPDDYSLFSSNIVWHVLVLVPCPCVIDIKIIRHIWYLTLRNMNYFSIKSFFFLLFNSNSQSLQILKVE